MSTKAHTSRKITAALAIIFLLPALIFLGIWSSIGLRNSGISEGDQMDAFIGYFPGWLRNINTIHAISIICCIIAIALAARGFKKQLLSIRVLMLIVVLVAIFILLFDFSQVI